MSYRYMRIIVMFDLPVMTAMDRKEYIRFRKYLIKSGFMMLQESVYCKIAPNSVSADMIVQGIKKNKTQAGLIQVLNVTEKQYAKMEYVTGKRRTDVIDSDERLIVL